MTQVINWNTVPDPVDKQVWERLTANFWLDTKIPISNDLPSWRTLTPAEQTLVKKVFASLTALDTLQSEVGAPTLGHLADTPHAEAVFTNIAFMESVHAKSYSTIFSTLCSTEEINAIFRWAEDDPHLGQIYDIIYHHYREGDKTLAKAYSVFLESTLFYTGFYTPLRLASEGRLTNTADIIRLILRDEGVHGYYIGYKFHKEVTQYTRATQDAIQHNVYQALRTLIDLEMVRVEQLYDEVGWTEEVKCFLRYNANKALANLGYAEPMFSPESARIPAYILASLDPGTGESHDFFSGSGASYVVGDVEDTTEEDWDW